ncbi:MAG: hypothetical protein QOH06_1378 [Acidobacteriota bacterium]|jgi:hypothetical protein|nr:hypothetical protein [Acidobacteriota bacterium]
MTIPSISKGLQDLGADLSIYIVMVSPPLGTAQILVPGAAESVL